MPPLVLDLRHAEDTRDVIHHAVQALAEGKLVGFPTETVYVLAASALSGEGVSRLRVLTAPREATAEANWDQRHPWTLGVKSVDDALDYVPDLPPLARRLGRRCWPGPLTLQVPDEHPESLLKQMSVEAREAACPAGLVGLRVPGHSALVEVLRLLAGPVVVAHARQVDGSEAVTAAEVVQAYEQDVALVIDDGPTRYKQPSSVVRVVDGRYEVLRVGVVSEQTLHRLSSMIVLFVCTGNTCRSPMAEGLFRQLLAEKLGCAVGELDDRGVRVLSAGVAAMMGSPASREAVGVMREQGIDLSGHESQPITESLVRHSDYIFAMTRSHRHALLAEWPDAADRVRLVNHAGSDVQDPVGGPPEVYRACAEQLRRELQQWIEELPW